LFLLGPESGDGQNSAVNCPMAILSSVSMIHGVVFKIRAKRCAWPKSY